MAKVALLIGVSEYGQGLTNLPGTEADLQAMQQVLENPQVGAFDQVQVLPNPNRIQMAVAIDTLFTQDRKRDDLVLLYFSGHGVRDDDGSLYFAANNTQKNAQGRLSTPTALDAATLHRFMTRSRSKRQVLILDCCFSGAFAQDMTAKADEAVDVKDQLGGEGRAVLTSSTATQMSFEKEGASVYTRYLTEGLRTGAADQDEDGQITIDELHQYAKEKVQEAAPTMQPEIYAVKEGYRILIAQAAQGDPKRALRKEAEARAKQKRGRFSPIDRRAFKARAKQLKLAAPEADQIIAEILQPYEAFWESVQEFEQALKETLDDTPQLSGESINDLRYLQRVLKLRDEDIAQVLTNHSVSLDAPPATTKADLELTKPASAITKTTQVSKPETEPEEIPLESEKGIDYSMLRYLLAVQDWKGADLETYLRMIEVIGSREGEWIRADELKEFPRTDLKTIDHLWVHYSKRHFGFSIQKEIWRECRSPTGSGRDWNSFCIKVGWQTPDASAYVLYNDLEFSLSSSRKGELPTLSQGMWAFGQFYGSPMGVWAVCALLMRTDL